MRATVDTSVIISGLISPHGSPAKVISRWRDGHFTLLYSPAILEELTDVLSRPWLTERVGAAAQRIPDLIEAVTMLGESVIGYVDVSGAVRDPYDEMFLQCARLGQADYLVSVDKDLLALDAYGSTQIVTPAEFLALLATRNADS